jgi:chromosome segregation ATPase
MERTMRQTVSAVLFLVAGTCLAAAPASATEDQPTHSDLVEMNATLKEIARSLKQQAATQKADVLLKRVTLATTQLATAQERWNRLEQERRALEGERGELETMLTAAQKETPDTDATRARIAGIRSHLQGLQDRLNALRQEQVAAENDVATLRREARDWQTLLDKMITGGS